MKQAITRKVRSKITIFLVAFLLFSSFSIFSTGMDDDHFSNNNPPSRGEALDGKALAVDKASSRIIGQEFPGPGGNLGTFLLTADLLFKAPKV